MVIHNDQTRAFIALVKYIIGSLVALVAIALGVNLSDVNEGVPHDTISEEVVPK